MLLACIIISLYCIIIIIIIVIIIITANRNLNTAAINSRRGMLTDLVGDTLALAVTRATKIFPLTYPYLA